MLWYKIHYLSPKRLVKKDLPDNSGTQLGLPKSTNLMLNPVRIKLDFINCDLKLNTKCNIPLRPRSSHSKRLVPN